MALILALTAKNMATIYVTEDVAFATQTAVIVLATGFLYLSVRWFLITLSLIAAIWLGTMFTVFEVRQIALGGLP